MNKSAFVVSAAFISSIVGHSCLAQPPKLVTHDNDTNLTKLLSSIRLINDVHLDGRLIVRVFEADEGSECDPGNEAKTCPRTKLYIVVGLSAEGIRSPTLWETAGLIGMRVKSVVPAEAKGGFGSVKIVAQACIGPGDPVPDKFRSLTEKSWHLASLPYFVSLEHGVSVDGVEVAKEECNLY